MSRVKTTICILLSVLLAAFLGVSFYRDSQEQQAQTAAAESLQAEAKPYEQELTEIRRELAEMEEAIKYAGETARFIVGFELSDVSDLSYIRELADTWQFSPVLVLDCTDELETLETYLDAAADTGWEIMLFGSSFSEAVNENVLAVRAALAERGLEDTGVFVLRRDYASTGNIQLLMEDGFIGYTEYNDTPAAGFTQDGMVHFDYSYMQSENETISSRLSLAYANKAAILALFDLAMVQNGTISESYVTSVLNTIGQYAEYEDGCFSTVADAVEELQSAQAIVEARQEEYDAYAAQQQERIDELNEIISEIYGKLSETP